MNLLLVISEEAKEYSVRARNKNPIKGLLLFVVYWLGSTCV